MTEGKRPQGWFEQMRRDGTLFTLVCALILVANLFQPLAQAQAGGQDGAWAICTTHGVGLLDASGDIDKAPRHSQDCPLCTAGHQCGSLSAPKLFAAVEPVFTIPQAYLGPVRTSVFSAPGGLPASSPPAIRAPPPFA
jgi:hypothetical protein